MQELFIVLAAEEKLPPLEKISKAIAEFRGCLLYEARSAAVKSFGFAGENLEESKAAELTAACLRNEVKAAKLPVSKLPVLQHPVIITDMSFENGSLKYQNFSVSDSEKLDELSVMAYAPIRHTTSKMVKTKEGPTAGEKAMRLGIMMATGLPIGLGKNKEVSKEVRSTETALLLDLVFNTGKHLRINSDRFNFSCLKEKKTYSAAMNLRLLCSEFAKISPSTLKNTAIYDLFEGKPAPTLVYEDEGDLEKEEKRLLALPLLNF